MAKEKKLPMGLIRASLQTVRTVLERHGEGAAVLLIDEVLSTLEDRSPAAVKQQRYRDFKRDLAGDGVTDGVTPDVTNGVTRVTARYPNGVTPEGGRNPSSELLPFSESKPFPAPSSPLQPSGSQPGSVLQGGPDVGPRYARVTPTTVVWARYAAAYEARYEVAPTRNARVNGQLANFVRRVPAEEAPEIAAFYVGSDNAYYRRNGHSIDCLLRDAEKLRTEWLTGRRSTATAAQRADKQAARSDEYTQMLARLEAKDAAEGGANG